MTLFEFKNALKKIDLIEIKELDGSLVPAHFHITEVGNVTKNFIDCGGVIRQENKVTMQLWHNEKEHRLHSSKLLNIIELAEEKLSLTNAEIEIEYQGKTIEKYGLEMEENGFRLTSQMTDCLAPDVCKVPVAKMKLDLGSLTAPSCAPGSNCC